MRGRGRRALVGRDRARRPGGAGRHAAGPRGHRAGDAGPGGCGMTLRFVDEFRDAGLGRMLADEIVAAVEPGRHVKVMEVCGGHTHSIYKYGVDDLLPANVEL